VELIGVKANKIKVSLLKRIENGFQFGLKFEPLAFLSLPDWLFGVYIQASRQPHLL